MMLAVHQGGLGNEAVSLRDAVRSQKPALDKFMSTIPTDDLRFLLDPSGVNLERRSTVLWSSGHKQSIELEQLPIDMVLAVVERMRLLGEYERISLSQAIANPEAGTR